jgi:hypothetical protein
MKMPPRGIYEVITLLFGFKKRAATGDPSRVKGYD